MVLFRSNLVGRWLFAALVVGLLVACGESSRYEEQYGAPSDQDVQELRIVSLAPALTKMIVDLDKEKVIVAVGQHDAAAPEKLPTVGNQWDIDTEALIRARPSHVLMQVGKDGPSPRLTELARTSKFQIITYPYPTTINEVADILTDNRHILGAVDAGLSSSTTNAEDLPQLKVEDLQALQTSPADSTSIGAILGEPLKAQTLWLRVMTKLNRVETATDQGVDYVKPRVLMAFGTKGTVTASGPGSVNDELLRLYVNAENAAGDATVSAPSYDREALLTMNPDVILLLMPGAPKLGSIDEDERLTIFRGLDITAVRQNRIVLLNDSMVLLPATNLADVAVQMAEAVHPERAATLRRLLEEGHAHSAAIDALRTVTRSPDEVDDMSSQPEPSGSTSGD